MKNYATVKQTWKHENEDSMKRLLQEGNFHLHLELGFHQACERSFLNKLDHFVE